MKQSVQCTLRVIRHQDLHLSLGKILDVLVKCTSLLGIGHGADSGFGVLLPGE